MKTSKKVCQISAMFLLLFLLTFCSKEVLEPVIPLADLEEFFDTLPTWEAFSPQLTAADKPSGDPVPDEDRTDIEGTAYNCSTTSYSLTETPDKITTLNPDVEVLYVGSLLQGNGHLNGIGSLAELPIRQRAPVQLTLDLLTDANNRIVDNPTVSTVNQAIGGLISDADAAGHKSGGNIYYTSEITHSLEQASLKMGLSASYMGATIKASLSSKFSQEKRTITAYFAQQMFTASMVLPQYPEDVFSEEFTQELLDREEKAGRMGPDNLPVYVSSIVYGRIMMFSFTSTSTEAKIQSTINAMYNGGEFGGELDTELQTVLDNAEISVVTVGGDAEHALNLIRENNLAAFFTKDAPLTSARPISYTMRNLKDNVIARVSETTQYNLKECSVAEPTGAEYTIKLTRIEALSFSDIDLTPNWAEIAYEFYLEDLAGPRDAAHIDVLHWLHVKDGEFIDIKTQDESGLLIKIVNSPTFDKVPLHLDGRDRISINGKLWDCVQIGLTPVYVKGKEFNFNRLFKGTAGLPFDSNQTRQFSITSQNNSGDQFRLYGNYTRTKLLFD